MGTFQLQLREVTQQEDVPEFQIAGDQGWYPKDIHDIKE